LDAVTVPNSDMISEDESIYLWRFCSCSRWHNSPIYQVPSSTSFFILLQLKLQKTFYNKIQFKARNTITGTNDSFKFMTSSTEQPIEV